MERQSESGSVDAYSNSSQSSAVLSLERELSLGAAGRYFRAAAGKRR